MSNIGSAHLRGRVRAVVHDFSRIGGPRRAIRYEVAVINTSTGDVLNRDNGIGSLAAAMDDCAERVAAARWLWGNEVDWRRTLRKKEARR